MFNLNWTSSFTNVSQQALFYDATYSLTEFVNRLKVRTIFADEYDSYAFVPDLSLKHESITEQRHRMYGRCYTYLPERYIRDLGVYYINAVL